MEYHALPSKWTNSATHNNMSESHHVEWNKLDVKLYIVYNSIYIMLKTVNLTSGGDKSQNSGYPWGMGECSDW